MAAKHCGKHDITYPEGGECWCCEEIAMTQEDKDRNYRDPAFLAKRGGAGNRQVIVSVAMDKLSQLSPEQLDRLIALAGGGAPGGAASPRTVITSR